MIKNPGPQKRSGFFGLPIGVLKSKGMICKAQFDEAGVFQTFGKFELQPG